MYKLKPIRLVLLTISMTISAMLFTNCKNSGNKLASETESNFRLLATPSNMSDPINIDFSLAYPPSDLASKNPNASLKELAEFAWQEFIGLNWPADTISGRATPNMSSSFLTASAAGQYTPVWQTYWHRNELFPPTGSQITVPDSTITAKPLYQYATDYSGTGKYTLWNNLDEVSELGEDIVFAHSTITDINKKYQVLYEAKMNFDGAYYTYVNKLFDPSMRAAMISKTAADTSKQGKCDIQDYICLPCGKLGAKTQGNIEIKAAWRQLGENDTIANFHTRNVIYYANVKNGTSTEQVYKNVTMGLVGLHIIHKTETFPDYVFATWEQKDNLSSAIVYTENQTTPFGDVAGDKVKIKRDHPIPATIKTVNDSVYKHLNTKGSFWKHYKLINVQYIPRDKSTVNDKMKDNEEYSSYYLSNSVIESNIELQNFTGSLTDSIFNNVIHKGKAINMGGCMGCHGNAQHAGTDFNFLIKNAPFSFPEFTGPSVGCPGGAEATPINSWADVLNFFNPCGEAVQASGAPHMQFWSQSGKSKEENYCYFVNDTVPNVSVYNGGQGIKICVPGHSNQSMIINYLKGTNINAGIGRMPAGTTLKYTENQIDELAKWIDNNCPYDKAKSVTPTTCTIK